MILIYSFILGVQTNSLPKVKVEVLKDKTLKITPGGVQKEWLEIGRPHLLSKKSVDLARTEVERETLKFFATNCPRKDGLGKLAWKSIGRVEIYGSERNRNGRFEMLGFMVYKFHTSQVGTHTIKPYATTSWVVDWLKNFPKGIPPSRSK